jgi:hypothetical protein
LSRESKFQPKVLKALNSLEHSWFIKLDQRSKRGDQDIIGVCRGLFIGVECKAEDGSETPLQTYKRGRTEQALGYSKVWKPSDYEEQLEELIKYIRKYGRK